MVISAWSWVHANHSGPRPLEGGEAYPWNEWHGIVWAWWCRSGVVLSLDLGWHRSRFKQMFSDSPLLITTHGDLLC